VADGHIIASLPDETRKLIKDIPKKDGMSMPRSLALYPSEKTQICKAINCRNPGLGERFLKKPGQQ
jgi:hypothetical protein